MFRTLNEQTLRDLLRTLGSVGLSVEPDGLGVVYTPADFSKIESNGTYYFTSQGAVGVEGQVRAGLQCVQLLTATPRVLHALGCQCLPRRAELRAVVARVGWADLSFSVICQVSLRVGASSPRQVQNHENFISNVSKSFETEACMAVVSHAVKSHSKVELVDSKALPKKLQTDVLFVAGNCAYIGEAKILLDDDATKQITDRQAYIR